MGELRDESKAYSLYRAMACGAVLAAMIVAVIASASFGLHWDLSGFGAIALAAAFLMLIGLRINQTALLAPLGDGVSLLGIWMAGAFACGAVAIMSTRTPMPLADTLFARADASVGLSAKLFVIGLGKGPPGVVAFLKTIYELSGFVLIATMVVLPLIGRAAAAWRCAVLIHGSLLCCALIAFLFPAYGIFVDIDPADAIGLPASAGRYAMEAVTGFRYGADPIISTEAMSGVISFPSFHTIIALVIVQSWAAVRGARWLVVPAAGLVIMSTLPMGGHYFVDLIAGLLLWWVNASALEWLATRRSSPVAQPAPTGVFATA